MPKRLTDEEREARAAAKRAKVEAQLEARKAKALERAKNAPIFAGQFHLAGVSHEGRAGVIEAEAEEGMFVRLVHHRENRHDKNAVAVYLPSDSMIGFVPREDAREYAKLLDAGNTCRAWIGAFWEGRYGRVPVIRVEFRRAESTPADDSAESHPEYIIARRPTSYPIGWLLLLAAGFALCVAAAK